MRAALFVVAGLALIGYIAVAWVLPSMAGSETRAAAEALVAGAEAAKKQKGVIEKDDPKHGRMKWIASENGAIRGWNEKNALEITLTPSMQGGKASWNCKGYPVGVMPASCGGKS
jgi:hypothetical protein